jgi:hypothetical protein
MLRRARVILGCLVAAGVASSLTAAADAASHRRAPGAPVITRRPMLAGRARRGHQLAVSIGFWSGAPTSYSYAWRRCRRSTCRTVRHAHRPTYAVGGADIGYRLVAVVTAHNAAGSASAASAASKVVAAGHPVGQPASQAPTEVPIAIVASAPAG